MIDLSKFKDLFVSETEDHLQKLNDNLLALEKNPEDKKLLDELMRSAHTIKSSAATMGYTGMAFLTHVMEDIFDYARGDIIKINTDIINGIFKAIDSLESSLESIKKENEELNVDSVIAEIKKLTGVQTEGIGKSKRTEDGRPIILNEPEKIENNEKNKDSATLVEVAEVEQKIQHIKVPIKRLDDLMDLMEELLIDKMKLERLKKKDAELEIVVNHLSRLISDIQYQVMQARLVPVDQILARFPRMIRDLSYKQQKEIDFVVAGGDLELDRTIVDKLGEPLVHLLRNAVDHGIEKKGTIKLRVKREKNFALIIVENDGRGIDFGKIKQAAVKRGIVDADKIESFNQDQLINLLYHSRISTNEVVTETSGRGVGLSIVKNFADSIGGRVILESPASDAGGVRFILELPLTLAIINVLLVRIKDSLFAIPFSSIERSVNVHCRDIKSIADQEVAVIGETDVPLIRIDKMFKLRSDQETCKIRDGVEVVLVKRGKDVAGIAVDALVGKQEIIVKTLPPILKKTKGFSGSTILGDGRAILVIDVVSLLEDARNIG